MNEADPKLRAPFCRASEEEEVEDDPLYCVACEKSFKSAAAMDNHKRSKKHKECVAALAQLMQDEDASMFNIEKVNQIVIGLYVEEEFCRN